MRFDWTRGLAIATVATMAWGCDQAPRMEVDAANTALQRARDSQAPQYAGDTMREAEQAKAELDRELEAQSEAWFKSFGRARELALETKDAAERATTIAISARDERDRLRVVRRTAATRRSAETRTAAAEVQPPVKIKDVPPVYPSIARAADVEGAVTIAAAIDANGHVTGTSVIRSVPLLNQAALDAVKQWQYEPQRVGGRPVPSVVTVTVNFVRS